MNKSWLGGAALGMSLLPWGCAGLMSLVSAIAPVVDGHRDPAAGLALLVLSVGTLVAWALGLGLAVWGNFAGLEGTPRNLARGALAVSLLSSAGLAIGCALFGVLVAGLSMR